MVRIFGPLVGLFFAAALLWSFAVGAINMIREPEPMTAVKEYHLAPKEDVKFAFNGAFGRFDKQQLQRGFQIYKEVCSNCHSLKQVAFRNLTDLGYSEAQVKTIAKEWATKAKTFDPKTGDTGERPNTPADHFPPVYYAGSGSPPDLSLITKARHEGPNYVYSLLTGYTDQPASLIKKYPDGKVPDGLYYNPYFANLNIAMPAPLADGQVTYSDGTKATLDQEAQDVAAFLTWTAEPKMEKRKQTGWAVLGFLIAATALAYLSKRTIWADKH
ncbi:cytochrome c1 [Novosphingobium sp. Fuku2-ISO-50]|uniref:cytochrome c1 n=1 Tax=Novosphingobium sp. Fuku2-ISO-50 TaxID=1739114 RepID=UPI00076DC6AB|nr:cytochrome c1 [Novosphingobium sp. Fuku2-ISO-50]KUR78804.1 cytochrome C [Novosphingobium sp. Fuku2-ISO-50]MDR3401992.1 cytochrome c1 [Chthoniobacter sp.]